MMENILISPDSLAASAGASGQTDPDASPASDSENGIRNVKLQLGILQRRPRREQERTYSELSAKYLPALVARFKGCSDPLNASMTLINAVSHTPYFVRFLRTDAGRGLAALQATRMASLEADDARPEQTAEMCQFLATLLLLQGTSDIEDADKRKLVMKLQLWKRKHNSSYASETSERCLGILTNDPHMQDMLNMVKRMSTKGVEECGAQGCGRRQMATGPDLLQCSRCKTAVYVRLLPLSGLRTLRPPPSSSTLTQMVFCSAERNIRDRHGLHTSPSVSVPHSEPPRFPSGLYWIVRKSASCVYALSTTAYLYLDTARSRLMMCCCKFDASRQAAYRIQTVTALCRVKC